MLVVICGQEGSGKSVALEIINQIGYPVFNTDQWLKEIYQYGEVGYQLIKDKINPQFVNGKSVDQKKLNDWIQQGEKEAKINQHQIKVNNLILPLIKKRLVALQKQYSIGNVVFVEFGDYFAYEGLFHDVPDAVICVIGRKKFTNEPNQKSNSPNPTNLGKNNYYTVDNGGSISQFKKNLHYLVQKVIKTQLAHRFHVPE